MNISPETSESLSAQEPGHAVLKALETLLDRDAYLLELDANERSISHLLATYLQAELPRLHVDCEYNRDGIDPKRIQHLYLKPDDEDTDAKTVFPDIIAHQRGTDFNYLVIEIKKTTSSVDHKVDYAKLRGYKASLGYKFALFIELIAGDGESGIKTAEWV